MGGRQGNGRGFSRLSGMTKSSRVPGCRMHLNPSAGCEQTAFALIFGRSRTAGHHSIQPVITTREAPLINGQWVTPTINYGLRIIISQTLNLHYGTGMKHSASPLPNHFTNCQAQLPVLVSTPISYRRTCLVNKSNKSFVRGRPQGRSRQFIRPPLARRFNFFPCCAVCGATELISRRSAGTLKTLPSVGGKQGGEASSQ